VAIVIYTLVSGHSCSHEDLDLQRRYIVSGNRKLTSQGLLAGPLNAAATLAWNRRKRQETAAPARYANTRHNRSGNAAYRRT